MKDNLGKILDGYRKFRAKYSEGESSIMKNLSIQGQKPETMVVSCSDSRVDPAILLQSCSKKTYVPPAILQGPCKFTAPAWL